MLKLGGTQGSASKPGLAREVLEQKPPDEKGGDGDDAQFLW